jgi:hypothetical protein
LGCAELNRGHNLVGYITDQDVSHYRPPSISDDITDSPINISRDGWRVSDSRFAASQPTDGTWGWRAGTDLAARIGCRDVEITIATTLTGTSQCGPTLWSHSDGCDDRRNRCGDPRKLW